MTTKDDRERAGIFASRIVTSIPCATRGTEKVVRLILWESALNLITAVRESCAQPTASHETEERYTNANEGYEEQAGILLLEWIDDNNMVIHPRVYADLQNRIAAALAANQPKMGVVGIDDAFAIYLDFIVH